MSSKDKPKGGPIDDLTFRPEGDDEVTNPADSANAPVSDAEDSASTSRFEEWLADAKKKEAEAAGAGEKPAAGDSPSDMLGDDRTPWYRTEEPKRPHYVKPPDPDRSLTPHRSEPQVSYYGKRVPRILITPNAYKRMCLYVDLAEKEVGWLGTVIMTRNGDFLIDNTYLLEQEVTPTETELSAEGQALLVEELLAKGEEGFEEVNRLRFWGHSHVRMGTYPSGTDERTMDRFYEEGLPWYVRGIFNKKGHGSFSVFLYEQGVRIDDVPWFVVNPETGETILEYKRSSPFSAARKRWKKVPKPEPKEGEDPEMHERLWGWRENYQLVEEEPPLPAALVIDDELKAEVTAEFGAKVKERKLFSFWDALFGDDKDAAPQEAKKASRTKPEEPADASATAAAAADETQTPESEAKEDEAADEGSEGPWSRKKD